MNKIIAPIILFFVVLIFVSRYPIVAPKTIFVAQNHSGENEYIVRIPSIIDKYIYIGLLFFSLFIIQNTETPYTNACPISVSAIEGKMKLRGDIRKVNNMEYK